jgi:YbbR domain-containing protein
MDGKVVTEKSYQNLSGQQNLNIDIQGLASGTYMVSVNTEGRSFIKMLSVK